VERKARKNDDVETFSTKSTEEDVASFASFAADAARSLATLARVFSFPDETGFDESGESRTFTGNDEILATTAVRLFFSCARAPPSSARTSSRRLC
jgi:hypothetical protein